MTSFMPLLFRPCATILILYNNKYAFYYQLCTKKPGELDTHSSFDSELLIGKPSSNSRRISYIHLLANTLRKGMDLPLLSQL